MTIMIPAWVDGQLMPVEKLAVHQRGLRHKAVSVFVMLGNSVLIQRRAEGKYHTPGLWANTCCTHPEWGEDSCACALRRLDEELGITGVDPVFREQVEYRAAVGNDLIEHEVVDIFVAQAPVDLRISPNPTEVMGTDWLSRGTLLDDIAKRPERYTPWLRIYMQDHAETIFANQMAHA